MFFRPNPGSGSRRSSQGIFATVQSPFANEFPRAGYRVAFCMKQVFDVYQRLDIALSVKSMARARLPGANT
jgi:hypothetical protein